MSYKEITPNISEIKTGTPAIKIGDTYFVGGIGGDFIPAVHRESVTLGQVNAEGKFQPLAFNGTEASNSGSPEAVESYYGFNGVLPVPESGGGATGCSFYKCASVDTVNNTWTGYKAILADGVYSFEEIITDGLIYGDGFEPQVDEVYNSDCTVIVSKFYTGPVTAVYVIPFNEEATTCQTGQALTQRGEPKFETIAGTQCVYIEDASFVIPDDQIDTTKFSVSFKYRLADDSSNDTALFWIGSGGNDFGYWLIGDRVKVGTAGESGKRISLDFYAEYDTWYDVLVTLSGDVLKVYIDGSSVLNDTFPINITKSGSFYIGAYGSNGQYLSHLPVYISDFRIYDEVVTPADL
jgi:hypothetical protein